MSDHSIFSPSAAHIWGVDGGCRAYPTLSAAYPDADSDASVEGRRAHELAAELVERAARAVAPPIDATGDDDISLGATLYMDYVAQHMRRLSNFDPQIEKRVHIPAVHELCFGTPDLYLWTRAERRLDVFDFKFGFLPVEVFENLQLIAYAIGCLDALGVDDRDATVVLHIVQPRAYHRDGPCRKWRLPATDLRPWRNKLSAAAEECLAVGAPTRTGSHCRYCPARASCAALRLDVSSTAQMVAQGWPDTLSATESAQMLSIVEAAEANLKAYKTGLEQVVEHALRKGESIPGYVLEEKLGNRVWTAPDDEIIVIGQAAGVDLKKPAAAVSPAQAEKKGLNKELVKQLTERPNAGLALKRVSNTKTRQIFGVKS